MSLSLLKQSLDILEQDSTASRTQTEKTTYSFSATKNISKQTFPKSSNPTRANTQNASNKHTKKIVDIKKEINQNSQKSKENLRKLLALSKNTIKNVDAEKIVKRAHKGRYVDMKISKPKQEVESIFTDEDFRAFEEEYFKS